MSNEKQKTILLVDDEVIIAMNEKMALEKFGYTVIMANNGEEAVAAVEKIPAIDLVLMDINLGSGIDGTEAAAIILRERDLPVVFLSSHMEPEIVAKTEKITSYGYVVKNSSITVLDASIKMAFKLFEAIKKEKAKESQMEAALAALRESEQRLNFHVNNSPLATIEWTTDFMVTRWSGEAEKIFGWNQSETIGKSIMDLKMIYDEDIPLVQKTMERLSDGSSKRVISTNRNYTKEGKVIICEWYNSVLLDPQGKMISVMSQVMDLTERKRDEEQLRFLSSVAENITDSITITDANFAITYINKMGEKLFGYTLDELKGQTPGKFNAEPMAEQIQQKLYKIVSSGNTYLGESLNRRKDGSIFYCEYKVTPLKDSKGIIYGYTSIQRDITERIRAEEKIKGLAKFPSENPSPILRLDKDGVVLYANEASAGLLQYWGCAAGSCAPKFWLDLVTETLSSQSKRTIVIEFGEQTYSFDVIPILDTGYVNLYGSNITERKRTEKALRESEEKFRGMAEQLEDVLFTTDNFGTITYISFSASRMFGWLPEEMIGRRFVEFLPKDEIPKAMQAFQTTISTGQPNQSLSLLMKRRDNSVFNGELKGSPVDKKRGIVGTLGLIRDITERKQAESQREAVLEALHESEERYRALVENASDFVYKTDKAGRFTYVNRAGLTSTGYEERELIGKFYPSLIRPDMRNRVVKIFLHQIRKGTPNTYSEFPILTKDGREIWLGQNIQLVMQNGRVTGFQAVSRDITERKRAESQREAALEALRESEDRYRDLVENSQDLICTHDLEGKLLSVNEAAARLTGYPIKDLLGMNMANLLDPEVRRIFNAYLKRVRAAGRTRGRMRIRTASGEARYWEYDNTLRTKGVTVPVVRGMAHDITERMRAEEEINRQLTEKEILLKEVHHRIKNNIASIGGLLSMHMQSVTNPEAIAVLQDAIGRVDSMRILYDKLLITEDYRDISVKNYVESLADAVLALFPDRTKIKLEKRIADFYLDPKQLFPLGLIINELITNKMKYAFIDREAGLITISLKNVAKHVTLDIRDNGNKLPAGFDMDKTKGFGLMLVKMLSQQLGGGFSIEKQKGTRCVVEFDI